MPVPAVRYCMHPLGSASLLPIESACDSLPSTMYEKISASLCACALQNGMNFHFITALKLPISKSFAA